MCLINDVRMMWGNYYTHIKANIKVANFFCFKSVMFYRRTRQQVWITKNHPKWKRLIIIISNSTLLVIMITSNHVTQLDLQSGLEGNQPQPYFFIPVCLFLITIMVGHGADRWIYIYFFKWLMSNFSSLIVSNLGQMFNTAWKVTFVC